MNPYHRGKRRKVFLGLLLIISTMLALAAVLVPLQQNSPTPEPQEGMVAPRDYRASQAVSFVSEVLTSQRRESAENAVNPIYTSPDTRVARRQVEQLRSALAYINSIREDAYASLDQKLDDISVLEGINLNRETAEAILYTADNRWQEAQQEAIAVLEQVMSSAIRPENLIEARSRVPALVSLSLSEEQAAIAAELATAFVAPNSQYSEGLTVSARLQARDAVEPLTLVFVPGQTIVLQGEVLTAEDMEILEKLGLKDPERSAQDLVSGAFLTILMVFFTVFYIRRKQILLAADLRKWVVLVALQLVFLVSARLIIPLNSLLPYAFPLATCGIVTAALFGTELALVTSIPLSILVSFGMPNALEITLFYLISSLFGVLALGRARRLAVFLWAGLAVACSGVVIVLVFNFSLLTENLATLLALCSAAFFNGLVSASFSILLHSLLAPFLGMLTPLQLLDLTRPDHPLLGLLLRDVPGTYQHSLQVANLAEQAAERIGVDPMLIRAGALYHDVGKAANPAFFIENQPPGFENPHDRLDPQESARLIIAHVSDGLKLARQHRLPGRIRDFISEHHGTNITRYQYFNAVKAVGGNEELVDQGHFRYPGPRPQSRETAVLMLADACEARVRAERPTEDDLLRDLVKSVVSDRISSGQLDDTRLSMRDLNEIVDSFSATLRGVYHPRLHYPDQDAFNSNDSITIPLPKRTDSSADLNLR